MRKLIRFDNYSREEVHDIFASHTIFTPQTGTWGLRGIVPIPGRLGDFVFFVTFGQEQGDHVFDESITNEGVLSWQSQPSQALNNRQIIQFINHDELKNSIYLFLRTKKGVDYTYFGKLKYISHDIERERPVYFQWQIIEWEKDKTIPDNVELELINGTSRPKLHTFEESSVPYFPFRQGVSTNDFQTYKRPVREEDDDLNKEIGLAGELLILAYEKDELIKTGHQELADLMVHVSIIEGDGAGFDILSFYKDGREKFIEVKTTTGSENTPFFITSNELTRSITDPDNYHLYRVYDFNPAENSGKFYMLSGNLTNVLELSPIKYKARPLDNSNNK